MFVVTGLEINLRIDVNTVKEHFVVCELLLYSRCVWVCLLLCFVSRF